MNNTIKYIAIATAIIIVIVGGYFYFKTDDSKAVVVKQEEAKDPTQLAPKISVTLPQAQEVIREVERSEPNVTYYITAPTLEKGAEQTAKGINNGDKSLPAIATEKTDRTAVVANTDKQKVDVYKVNLSPKILRSAGYMLHAENVTAPGVATYDIYKRVNESGFYIGGGATYDIHERKVTIGAKAMW